MLQIVAIRAIYNKFEHIKRDQALSKQAIIFVTETWIHTNHHHDLEMEGFFSAFANQGRGKGVGVYFKKDAIVEKCEETLYQFIKFKDETKIIFCIYLSKGVDYKQVVTHTSNGSDESQS